MSNSSWAQNEVWDEGTEEFNRKLDSIQEGLDYEFEEDDIDDEYIDPSEEGYVSEGDESIQSAADYEPELRQVNERSWERLKKDKRFKYKKKKPKKKKKKTKKKRTSWFDGLGAFFNSGFFMLILYLLLAAFLGFIIYLFIKNNNISFRKNVKDQGVVQEDPWEDVQHFDDWELALQRAIESKDYRLATRIYYLQTLHLLDKGGQINYREDRTNWFYVQKLFSTEWHDDFMGLTKIFDYIWYGEYQIGLEQFEVLQSQFQNFNVRLQ